MTRVGFLLKVKEERIEEYKKHHEAVWPEMLEALRQTGWHNYSLFMKEDGTLFGYFETPGKFPDRIGWHVQRGNKHEVAGFHGPILRHRTGHTQTK